MASGNCRRNDPNPDEEAVQIRQHQKTRTRSRAKYVSQLKTASGIRISSDDNAYILNSAKLLSPKTLQDLATVLHLVIKDEDNMFKTIPSKLCRLDQLQSLVFTKSRMKSLPSSLFHLNLNSLCLADNALHSIKCINKMTSLVELDISGNQLKTLPGNIFDLILLEKLNVSGNKIVCLPDGIANLPALTTFNCSGNRLKSLPENFGKLQHSLHVLDISFNSIEHLPDSFGCLSNLTELQATRNHLYQLPQPFANLHNLRHILVSGNQFVEVPVVLQGLTSLVTLNMRQNKLTTMISSVPTVTILLDNNKFQSIPTAITDCVNLEILSMENNEVENISTEISKLTKLRALYLGGNHTISAFPEELCNSLVNLRHLTLHDTQVSALPRRFDSLRRLSMLDLHNCKELEGSLYMAYKEGVGNVMEYVKQQREYTSADEKKVSSPAVDTKEETVQNGMLKSSIEEGNSEVEQEDDGEDCDEEECAF